MRQSREEEIERYLRTWEHDMDFGAWPGADFIARGRVGHAASVGSQAKGGKPFIARSIEPGE